MRAQIKALIVKLAIYGLLPATVTDWLIKHGGLRNA